MGLEFDMYEITALTLMRNDARADSFTANLQELEQRARTLPSPPHWHKTPRDIVRSLFLKQLHYFVLSVFAAQAAALSAELEACRAGIEQSGIDGARLAGMGDAELQGVAASVGGKRLKEKLLQELKDVREVCEAQVATMRHFEE